MTSLKPLADPPAEPQGVAARSVACQADRQAANSVGLNPGEGLYACGGNRTVRIESAMNSGREVMLGLRISGAVGYLEAQQVGGGQRVGAIES